MAEKTKITHLERRKIEAGVLVPMVRAFQRVLGEEAANAVVVEVIGELARQDGQRWAREYGSDLAGLEKVVKEVWAGGGSLDIEMVGKTKDRLEFDVVRCRYAEFYKERGLEKLGCLFHCGRDHAAVQGLSADIQLKRTQTIMEGASHCDFRFEVRAQR